MVIPMWKLFKSVQKVLCMSKRSTKSDLIIIVSVRFKYDYICQPIDQVTLQKPCFPLCLFRLPLTGTERISNRPFYATQLFMDTHPSRSTVCTNPLNTSRVGRTGRLCRRFIWLFVVLKFPLSSKKADFIRLYSPYQRTFFTIHPTRKSPKYVCSQPYYHLP